MPLRGQLLRALSLGRLGVLDDLADVPSGMLIARVVVSGTPSTLGRSLSRQRRIVQVRVVADYRRVLTAVAACLMRSATAAGWDM